jgi:hypothetical protein
LTFERAVTIRESPTNMPTSIYLGHAIVATYIATHGHRPIMYVSQKFLISMTLLGILCGCSVIESMTTMEDVKPWQKGTLAKPEMELAGDPIDKYVDEHIYFSKEGSTGGSSVGGGGCGCN